MTNCSTELPNSDQGNVLLGVVTLPAAYLVTASVFRSAVLWVINFFFKSTVVEIVTLL